MLPVAHEPAHVTFFSWQDRGSGQALSFRHFPQPAEVLPLQLCCRSRDCVKLWGGWPVQILAVIRQRRYRYVFDAGSNLLPFTGHGDAGPARAPRLCRPAQRRQEWDSATPWESSTSIRVPPSMGGSSGKQIFPAAIMNCTISAGMLAARAFVRKHRTRTWSVAT